MCQKPGCYTRPTDVLTHVCPKLVPFFKTVGIYYVAWLPSEYPSIISALIKCLPIICLALFVWNQGISLQKEHDYQRRIWIGLIFSCIGDALLIWSDIHFVTAMASFAIAHVSYIRAFGFYRLCWLKALPFVGIVLAVMYLLYPGLQGILLPGVFIYIWIIGSMGWRAVAQVDILENQWSWTSLCGCLGAISFMMSDFLIGINKFVTPVPYERVLIMTTYYLAQVLIALSAVNTNTLVIKLRISNRRRSADHIDLVG